MTHSQFLRMKKLTGKAIIRVAAKHNHRELVAEFANDRISHIDSSRTPNNIVLRGPATAMDIEHLAERLMAEAGMTRLRKDAVRALEIVFSLPPSFKGNTPAFFSDAVQWSETYFNVPVISAIVHNDEAAPHCHVLLLPLVNGRMIGSELMGNRSKLRAIQADFQDQIATRYGLIRQRTPTRLSSRAKRQAAEKILQALKLNPLRIDDIAVRESLLAAIGRSLEPLLLALGLTYSAPKPKRKTFVEVMTMPVKPEKPIGFDRKTPIGFASVKREEKHQTLSCVGFGTPTTSISIYEQQQMERANSCDQALEVDTLSEYWEAQIAEFV